MPVPKAKPEEDFDQAHPDFELEGLADKERAVEAKKILKEAREGIASTESAREILDISDQARQQFDVLYEDSNDNGRDLSRFQLALAKATKIKAEKGRAPFLVEKSSQLDLDSFRELKDSSRRNEALEILENAKLKILEMEENKLILDFMNEVFVKWDNLYKGSTHKEDLENLKREFSLCVLRKSASVRKANDK